MFILSHNFSFFPLHSQKWLDHFHCSFWRETICFLLHFKAHPSSSKLREKENHMCFFTCLGTHCNLKLCCWALSPINYCLSPSCLTNIKNFKSCFNLVELIWFRMPFGSKPIMVYQAWLKGHTPWKILIFCYPSILMNQVSNISK